MQQAGALGIGGLTRCLAVATEAALLGHQVAFFCRKEVQGLVRRMIDARIYTAPVPPQLPAMNRSTVKNFTLADSIKIRKMHNLGYLEDTIRAEVEAIEAYKPDFIFTENQFTAAISSQIASVPLATTAASVNHPRFMSPLYKARDKTIGVEENFNIILDRYGLDPISDISDLSNGRSALNIAPTIEELEPLVKSFPNNHYVGQLLFSKQEVGPLDKDLPTDGPPVIFVYMSRGSITPEYFLPKLKEAFDNKKCFVAVAMRESHNAGRKLPYNLSKNIRLYNMLPGISVISRSTVVITRGGQNTTMGCMLTGTPMLGFPGDSAEADFNIRSVAANGAAKLCTMDDLQKLAELTEELSMNSEFRKSAANLGDKIRKLDGARTAVRLMEKNV